MKSLRSSVFHHHALLWFAGPEIASILARVVECPMGGNAKNAGVAGDL